LKTYAMTINLKDSPCMIDQYKQYHLSVWPEVISALNSIGVLNMKIFLRNFSLFMYMETEDHFEPDRDLKLYTQYPRAKEWDDLMRNFQKPVSGIKEGEWWASMEEVFDINW